MFSKTSIEFHSKLTKGERQEQGIFFTPKGVRDLVWNYVSKYIFPETILEPSFGSGEFLKDVATLYPAATLYGVEKNPELFRSVDSTPTLSCMDFMEWDGPKVDLIVANPPYFEMKTKEKSPYMSGKPNIYVSFLYKCITEHLKEDGVLAFIIPTSIYNASNYQGMRDYIRQNTTILHVETLVKPGFKDTTQKTCLLVLRMGKYNDMFWFMNKYISPHSSELSELTNYKTLEDLGLSVKTGNIVWNENKDYLSDQGTLLIYSTNIANSTLTLHNLSSNKKQYIQGVEKEPLRGKHILVSRGYGNSSTFHAVLVDLPEFYAENHLNVIYSKTGDVSAFDRVMKSFHGPLGQKFIQYFIGNGAMSSKELATIFPIE